MANIEKRIERLENREGAVNPEKLLPLLLKLHGFNRRSVEDALEPNATLEEALAYLRGKNPRLSGE